MHFRPATESLEALLDRLIDYAGMFPPASLDFDPAIRSFVRYLSGPDAWILRSFVCPARRLGDLQDYADLLRASAPAPVTVLGAPTSNEDEWKGSCRDALSAAAEFNHAMAGIAEVRSFEMKLPRDVAVSPAGLEDGLRYLGGLTTRLSSAEYFVEVVPPAPEPQHVAAAASRLRGELAPIGLGLKIRTGGVSPDQVPPAEDVARFICACRDHGVPFKATAGLHHPLYHYSRAVGSDMHGFLNVFVGSIVAIVHGIDESELTRLLRCGRPGDIGFTDDVVTFDRYTVTREDVYHWRRAFAVSFGSCSFDEPRQDLLDIRLGATA